MSGEAGHGAVGALARAERVRELGDDFPVDLEALIAALEDPDALVRGSAVIALLDEDPERALAALADNRQERESTSPGQSLYPGPRILEYELIARASMNQPIQRLGREVSTERALCPAALSEPDQLVRSRAFAACVRVGEPDAEWLDAAIRDPSWTVRARLANALASLDTTSATADPSLAVALQRLATDQHPTVRHAARRAIN